MITVQILERFDVIEANDFARPLNLMYEGQSDYLMTNSTYGGTPINRLGWMRAKFVCPFWVGKTVGEFLECFDAFNSFEFVRGDVPIQHQEKLTKEELLIVTRIWERYFNV